MILNLKLFSKTIDQNYSLPMYELYSFKIYLLFLPLNLETWHLVYQHLFIEVNLLIFKKKTSSAKVVQVYET